MKEFENVQFHSTHNSPNPINYKRFYFLFEFSPFFQHFFCVSISSNRQHSSKQIYFRHHRHSRKSHRHQVAIILYLYRANTFSFINFLQHLTNRKMKRWKFKSLLCLFFPRGLWKQLDINKEQNEDYFSILQHLLCLLEIFNPMNEWVVGSQTVI